MNVSTDNWHLRPFLFIFKRQIFAYTTYGTLHIDSIMRYHSTLFHPTFVCLKIPSEMCAFICKLTLFLTIEKILFPSWFQIVAKKVTAHAKIYCVEIFRFLETKMNRYSICAIFQIDFSKCWLNLPTFFVCFLLCLHSYIYCTCRDIYWLSIQLISLKLQSLNWISVGEKPKAERSAKSSWAHF